MDRKIKLYPYCGNYSVRTYLEDTLRLICYAILLLCFGTAISFLISNYLPLYIAALTFIILMIRSIRREEPKRKAINLAVALDSNKHLWLISVNPEKPKGIIDTRDLQIPDLDRAATFAKNYIYVRNYINDVLSGRIVNISPYDTNTYIELSDYKKVSEDDNYIYIEGNLVSAKKKKSKKIYKISKTYDNIGELFSGIDPFDSRYKWEKIK